MATHVCQLVTEPPRIEAESFSAGKMGKVDALDPMADEESFLGLAETGTDNREETGDGVEENGTATSGVKVERVRKPTTTMEEPSTKDR